MTTDQRASEFRTVCHSCFRPQALCYCGFFAKVENRTPVLIIQHPHERFHPFGTTRIAERCLGNVRIEVDYNRTLRDGDRTITFPKGAALLYPGPDARDLASVPETELPASLVVLDGTWHQAKALYRDIPALHDLPKVCFAPDQPSQYRIRKEPSLECVSTVEAIVHALRLLEPDTPRLDAMLEAFAGMIDLQIETGQNLPRKPRFPKRDRVREHGLPILLTEDFDRVVVVYCEATFTGEDARNMTSKQMRRKPKHLIHWVARRLRTGETFSMILRPPELPTESRLCPTGLSADDLLAGIELPEAIRAWSEFVLPEDILVSWNKSTLDAMKPLAHDGPTDFLKGIYKNFARRRDRDCELQGSISSVMERESLLPGPALVAGRAGLCLSQIEMIARFLNESAISWPQVQPARSVLHTSGAENGASRETNAADA